MTRAAGRPARVQRAGQTARPVLNHTSPGLRAEGARLAQRASPTSGKWGDAPAEPPAHSAANYSSPAASKLF